MARRAMVCSEMTRRRGIRDRVLDLHRGDLGSDRQYGPFLDKPLDQSTGIRGLHIGRCLVGLHHVDGFIATDCVAGLLEELYQ